MLYFAASILFCVCAILFAYEWRKYRIIAKKSLFGKHVLVTGGSSGIGKAIALDVVKRGANVSIFARDQAKLESTKEELSKHLNSKQQEILIYSVDISRNYSGVENAVQQVNFDLVRVLWKVGQGCIWRKAIEKLGAVSLLINCAGTAVSYTFEDTPLEDFQRMLDINYIGSVNVTRAALPSMKIAGDGTVVFVSSLAGLLGLYGYTAYSASKFALVGFAEALQMELKPFNVSVTLSFPPDTDTPGYEEEQKTKPLETQKISESGGLVSAETVATQTVRDALAGRFVSTVGMEGLMLSTVCSGMMPVSSLVQAIFQVLTMGIFRIVAIIFLKNSSATIMQCHKERQQQKKES